MASEGAVEKRANLVASRAHWSNMDLLESISTQYSEAHGNSSQDSIREWLTVAVTEEDAKHVLPREAAEPLRRNPSSEDDLALGVEASLYGKQGVKTFQEFLRWTTSSPLLSRWNSISSAASGHSGPLSVMDVLNLWNDDPEEVLLDLGFGCDEPDISGRIPARFINHQSQARGINLHVFLEAQKNRLDLENPDVSNRFRQLEVLQQVTTAFSSLVGASSSSSNSLEALQPGRDLPTEAQERRRRMGILFRRASKKSLSQTHNHNTQDPTTQTTTYSSTAPQPLQPLTRGDKKTPVKRVRPGLQETVCLSPLPEEQGPGPDTQPQPQAASFIAQEGALRPGPLKEGHPLTPNTAALQRKRNPGQARESFEMEEIHSFDESSITGSYTGGAENIVWGIMRTNSSQSDSSGFLEEPFIPQQASPGPEVIKALSGLSGSTDSQITMREASSAPPYPTSPSLLPYSSMTSSGIETFLLSSPSPPLEPSLAPPTPPPLSLCLSKTDSPLKSPEKQTPPDQDLLQPPCNPPASFSALMLDSPLPPDSSSTEFEDMAHSQSSTPPSPASLTSPSVPSSSHLTSSSSGLMCLPQPDSCVGGPEKIQTGEGDAPHTSLSTFSPELEGKASSRSPDFPPATSPPSPFPDSHCPSSFDSPSRSPEDTQTEKREACPLSSLPPDSDGLGLCHPLTETQMDDKATLLLTSLPLYSHLHEEDPSPPSSFPSASSKFEEYLPELSCLSPSSLSPICQYSILSSLPSASAGPDDLTDSVFGRIPDPTEHSVTQQDGPCHHDDDTDSAPDSAVQHVIKAKTDYLAVGSEDNLKKDRGGEGQAERQTDTVQTAGAVVYNSDTDCSTVLLVGSRSVSEGVHYETEIEPQVHSYGLHDVFPAKTKLEEFRIVSQVEIDETESESHKSYFVSCDELPKIHNRTVLEPNMSGLIEIESLDLVFETSVDGSEGEAEYGDVDAICREMDSDGHVYWAEPIQVSTPSPVLEESGSFEASESSPVTSDTTTGPTALDSSSSTGKALYLSSSSSTTLDSVPASSPNASLLITRSAFSGTSPSLAPAPFYSYSTPDDLNRLGMFRSSRSVSVQMSSCPSSHSVSHIVHRKDVPYITDSKTSPLPCVLALDTSTPLRAVQSWTDLQIQRNTLTNTMPYGGLHTLTNQATIASETTKRPVIFSSSPSFPVLSSDCQSRESLPRSARSFQTKSVSLDTGLWPDEEKHWEGNLMTNVACCCSCDHRCTCCTQNSSHHHTVGNLPCSLGELEGMMLCLRQFHLVLNKMEEQLSEDQASVYNTLSDHDREEVRDIVELRRAVKQEAEKLELQLSELAHHYDDSFKMKMHRLLDEQSLLCSQLRLFPPGAMPTLSGLTSSRTVATQCCLLPWLPLADMSSGCLSSRGTWNLESSRHSLPGSEVICEGLGCSPTKADKLDFVGFLQRLKESLRHSVNTDSLE